MKTKVLIVYQFATFGGVERVILNRAEAFKLYGENYKLYVYFYEDYGAKESLRSYIKKEELDEYIEIIDDFKVEDYDYVFTIDTPQLFEQSNILPQNVFIESHTVEKKYRTYLKKYFSSVRKVIVPSQVFYDQLVSEYGDVIKDKLYVLSNFVLSDMKKSDEKITLNLPEWTQKIAFYFGRIDENKNIKEFVSILKEYREQYGEDILGVIVGKIDPEYKFWEHIKEEDMSDKIVILPPIKFEKIDLLLNALKNKKAVFVSSSRGETFSLSSAEAISASIPSVLSDIDAHKELVGENDKFLYTLGDASEGAKKLDRAFKKYDEYAQEISKYKSLFSSKNFIDSWNLLLGKDSVKTDEDDN